MSQYPAAFDHAAPPKMSGLAVTALVCSLVFCCPVTTVLGVLLGLIALASIGSNPAKKGRGVAVTAILIGLLATAGQAWVGVKWIVPMWQLAVNGPGPALTAGFAGDTAGFKSQFHGPGASATDTEATAFIDELRNRYGEYQSVALAPTQDPPPFGAQTITYKYDLVFTNANVSAETELIFADDSGFVLKIGSITVLDEQKGDLTFPPGP